LLQEILLMLDLLIPWQARECLRSVLEFPARRAARKNLGRIQRGGRLSVGFGGVLNDGRPVHGGAVKLLPLQKAFDGSEESFGILYAVSSSPPQVAAELFEHCRKSGIRIVWNQNGVGYPAWAGKESERFNAPMRKLRDAADYIVHQSEFCKISAARFLGPCETPSSTLYNPVDLDVFSPDPEKTFSGSPLRLLAAGTHGTRDRVTSVLEALGELREGGVEAELTMAGRFHWPRGEQDFASEVARRGLADVVHRVPTFSQSDAPALYRAHDLLVHPKYMDPCPTVVLEAMASGLPIVGSRSGGMPELVPGDCGALIDAPLDWDNRHTPSGKDLAVAVAGLRPDLQTYSTAARANAQSRFDVGRWTEAHARIFQELRDA